LTRLTPQKLVKSHQKADYHLVHFKSGHKPFDQGKLFLRMANLFDLPRCQSRIRPPNTIVRDHILCHMPNAPGSSEM
jgi:hypothetical protein